MNRLALFFIIFLVLTAIVQSQPLPPDTLWTHTYGYNRQDGGYSVQQTTDGGFIIAGYSGAAGPGNYKNICLIKTNAEGIQTWFRSFGGHSEDIGRSVQQTNDGGYIISGYTNFLGQLL
jgi:hypothetical protein